MPIKPKEYQVSFEDLLYGVKSHAFERSLQNTMDTRTVYRENTPPSLLQKIDINELIRKLIRFNAKHQDLIAMEDKTSLYRSFKIPKHSGGLRQIDAPNDELMSALRELKVLFETQFFATYHTSAFAYVKGRCTIDAVKRHQINNSRWFLKLDFHNFFGSTTIDFLMSMLALIFPFNLVIANNEGKEVLRKALSLCFLNGGLPQGTPISPTLTNLMMIPLDHSIAKYCREHSPHLCYTRYADDIIISSEFSFRWNKVQADITAKMSDANAPFKLNTSKTRYGSSAGRNWNLGVMLNKDNQITIGHQKKKAFKAMLFSILNDNKNGIRWSVEDAQELGGLISYYEMVEKETITKIIKEYSAKFGVDVKHLIKETIKQN